MWLKKGLLIRESSGHCVMCEWCAAQSIPSHKTDKTRPAKPSNCPLCRKRVKQKVRLAPCYKLYMLTICKGYYLPRINLRKENSWIPLSSCPALNGLPVGRGSRKYLPLTPRQSQNQLDSYHRRPRRPQMYTAYSTVRTISKPAEQHP